MDRTSRVSAVHVETGSEGAVFRIVVEADALAKSEETNDRYRDALNAVDDFCQSYFDNSDPRTSGEDADVEPLENWQCDEFGVMPFKYRGLGGDWSEMAIVIADRWLAARFKREFCSREERPNRVV